MVALGCPSPGPAGIGPNRLAAMDSWRVGMAWQLAQTV